MVKIFLGCFVGLVVILQSLYVFPVQAISHGLVISQIQAGGIGAPTHEFISVYNKTSETFNITDWCFTNKTNLVFACFSGHPDERFYLEPHSYAVVMSSPLTATMSSEYVTSSYTPTSQSSGSITGGGDTISFIESTGRLIDQHTWTTALTGGTHLARHTNEDGVYADTDTNADWGVVATVSLHKVGTYIIIYAFDACLNIEGDQPSVPVGMELDIDSNCIERIVTRILITEVLPNAIGGDEGNEYIEIFNPNDFAISLSEYKLFVGPELSTKFDFPADIIIPAQSYVTISNSALPYSLLNSSSRLQITTLDGVSVDEVPAYQNPKEGASWALIGGVWQYTNLPTLGAENVLIVSESEIGEGETEAPKPCAVNQYRNPDTGRCRLIATTGSAVTPCKDGQYRSEETNRCRAISTDANTPKPCEAGEERNVETGRCRKVVVAAVPTPCKEGMERSPDTNRCRTIKKMPNVDYGVLGAKTESSNSWYIWAAIGIILILAIGYAIWEWHYEIGKMFHVTKEKVIRFARPHK